MSDGVKISDYFSQPDKVLDSAPAAAIAPAAFAPAPAPAAAPAASAVREGERQPVVA